ncbi:MAG: TetR family transcriptional regulator [Anaerolineae bacterium]
MRRTKAEAMQTREQVLKAAATVIAQQGVNAFTIEAVAQEAGVTKGGVLHHFPSKVDLVTGLIDEVVATFNARLQAELNAEPEGQPGRWLRAYLRTVFFADFADGNLLPALAASVAAEPDILVRIRRSYEESQQAAVDDGIDPVLATIIRLATDGLVFTRAFGMDVLDSVASQNTYQELVRLTGLTSATT